MTDSSQTRLAYIAEVTPGVTPATPAFKKLRMTGESLAPSLQYTSSNEIRADRNVADMTRVGQEAGGDINFELSYGTFDDFLEALMFGTWTTNVLKNGVTKKTFTIEETFAALANQFHRYTGSMVNSLSLSMRAKEVVTGSFNIMSQNMTQTQAIVTGATYVEPNSNPVLNAANNFAALAMTGGGTVQLMSLSLNISNNLEQQPVMGQVASKGIRAGQFMVTGEAEAYFDTPELMDLYLGDTPSDLTFSLGGASSLKYTFFIPKLKLTANSPTADGNNQDVMQKISFQAYFDATTAAQLRITRTP
ncbi:phage tail tube protein [Dyadobacter sp. CY356]|uniref:phage tail tube protein n=1 Tax=Dyadobacter sp. CY356 TaxID=2906442 RepID=UPI001F1A6C85|nr:phage tail tube protein [Dyadobacter sp. CY356]MCF0055513.1 phage tail tube protein [Dyadobacter sp. CY356]